MIFKTKQPEVDYTKRAAIINEVIRAENKRVEEANEALKVDKAYTSIYQDTLDSNGDCIMLMKAYEEIHKLYTSLHKAFNTAGVVDYQYALNELKRSANNAKANAEIIAQDKKRKYWSDNALSLDEWTLRRRLEDLYVIHNDKDSQKVITALRAAIEA